MRKGNNPVTVFREQVIKNFEQTGEVYQCKKQGTSHHFKSTKHPNFDNVELSFRAKPNLFVNIFGDSSYGRGYKV